MVHIFHGAAQEAGLLQPRPQRSWRKVHEDVDTVSRRWKFRWSRGSPLFSVSWCARKGVCAHRLAKHVISPVTSSILGVGRQNIHPTQRLTGSLNAGASTALLGRVDPSPSLGFSPSFQKPWRFDRTHPEPVGVRDAQEDVPRRGCQMPSERHPLHSSCLERTRWRME